LTDESTVTWTIYSRSDASITTSFITGNRSRSCPMQRRIWVNVAVFVPQKFADLRATKFSQSKRNEESLFVYAEQIKCRWEKKTEMWSNLSNIQKKSAYGCLSAADSEIRIFSEAFFLNGSERKWTVSQSQWDFGFLFARFTFYVTVR